MLLICALKEECDQVLKVTDGLFDPGWVKKDGPKGWTVFDGVFATENGTPLHIRASWADRMGRESVQAVTSLLIHEQPARCVAMSGICAGRRSKLVLGDVIFANQMWAYDAGKLVVEEGKEHFQGDLVQYRPKSVWVQRMQQVSVDLDAQWLKDRPEPSLEYQEEWVLIRILAGEDPTKHVDFSVECPDWEATLKRLWERDWLDNSVQLTNQGRVQATKLSQLYPNVLPKPPSFGIHVAPMGTGAMVVEDEGVFPRLAKSMRKVLGIEMEASALAALGEVHDIPVVVAKGASDYGDTFKDERYRDFSARAAAECLISFLKNSVDLLPGETSISTDTHSKCNPEPISSPDLINLFAESYPDVRDARALWQRAGGRASEVESISRPRDLWQRLWQHSQNGALVTPEALLRAALEDFPENVLLTECLSERNKN